jgi:hypothetical protein
MRDGGLWRCDYRNASSHTKNAFLTLTAVQ